MQKRKIGMTPNSQRPLARKSEFGVVIFTPES